MRCDRRNWSVLELSPLHQRGSGPHWNDWNPSFEDIAALSLSHIRTKASDIDPDHPKLMPECRVNEWAVLLNRKTCVKEGDPYFGYFNLDLGTEWFKALYKRGHAFKHYRQGFQHCYFSKHQDLPHKSTGFYTGSPNDEQEPRLFGEFFTIFSCRKARIKTSASCRQVIPRDHQSTTALRTPPASFPPPAQAWDTVDG
jgi:hypothetical protein